MNDVGGTRALIDAVSRRFQKQRGPLLCAVALVFMGFGAFLGQFEEMLTLLPIITALCVLTGLDSFTGLLICIVASGFGFASAITNPFTVLLASRIIDVNPMEHIGYRVLIFAAMYLLLLAFVFLYARRLKKDPRRSLTFSHDEKLRATNALKPALERGGANARRARVCYISFLLTCLALLIACSAVSALRELTVPVLIAYCLVFGIGTGIAASGTVAPVFKSFLRGVRGALPTVEFIALASSVKYVFDEGGIMPTIVHSINALTAGKSPYAIALILYALILALEFFISSSTAKAVLVMGMLAVVNVNLSKPMLVLIYTFADGYTNVLFPTSPVLLIALSMIEVDYFKWLKESAPLFLANLALVALFLCLGIAAGY